MAGVYPYLLPNGIGIDLQNVTLAVDIYNNVVITGSSGATLAKVPCATTQVARQLISTLITAMGFTGSVPHVSTVLWSVDNVTYQALPINISPGGAFYIQINGSNLPTTGQYIQVDMAPIWLLTASSATQLSTGAFAASLPAGTYDCQVFDSGNNLLADLGNIITIVSS